MWTQFMDMHSGGGLKLDWQYIYIEALQEEAELIFQNRFNRNPNRVTCTCCGEDYSISESPNLKQATGYERGCDNLETPKDKNGRYENDDPVLQEHYYIEPGQTPPKGHKVQRSNYRFEKYQTLAEYKKRDDVLIIPKKDIKSAERTGELEDEGYIWVD